MWMRLLLYNEGRLRVCINYSKCSFKDTVGMYTFCGALKMAQSERQARWFIVQQTCRAMCKYDSICSALLVLAFAIAGWEHWRLQKWSSYTEQGPATVV